MCKYKWMSRSPVLPCFFKLETGNSSDNKFTWGSPAYSFGRYVNAGGYFPLIKGRQEIMKSISQNNLKKYIHLNFKSSTCDSRV